VNASLISLLFKNLFPYYSEREVKRELCVKQIAEGGITQRRCAQARKFRIAFWVYFPARNKKRDISQVILVNGPRMKAESHKTNLHQTEGISDHAKKLRQKRLISGRTKSNESYLHFPRFLSLLQFSSRHTKDINYHQAVRMH
jgi:hypothetical protein